MKPTIDDALRAKFLTIAQDPRIVHGAHHHCDEWCAYCPVAPRCFGHRCTQEFNRAMGRPPDAGMHDVDEALALTRAMNAIDGSSCAEIDALTSNRADYRARMSTADPLASVAWEYAVRTAIALAPVTPAILAAPTRMPRPSPHEVILYYHLRIHMRVVRALVARAGRVPGGTNLAEDALGSAKLALVMVEKSRVAWASLGRGEPADDIDQVVVDRMVALLQDLEHGIDSSFPAARGYVRVGLDVPAA